MDSCKYELYNKELRFEEPNRCLSLVRKNRPTFCALRQRLWNGGKKRGQRERKMFYNARCVNKGI